MPASPRWSSWACISLRPGLRPSGSTRWVSAGCSAGSLVMLDPLIKTVASANLSSRVWTGWQHTHSCTDSTHQKCCDHVCVDELSNSCIAMCCMLSSHACTTSCQGWCLTITTMIRTCAQTLYEVVQNCVLHIEQLCKYGLESAPLHMSLCSVGHCPAVCPCAACMKSNIIWFMAATVLMYTHVQDVTCVNTSIIHILLKFLSR